MDSVGYMKTQKGDIEIVDLFISWLYMKLADGLYFERWKRTCIIVNLSLSTYMEVEYGNEKEIVETIII